MFQGFIIVFGETGTQQKHASVQILINMTIMSSKKDFITAAFLLKLLFHRSNLMKSGEAPFESNLIIRITGIIVYFCSKLALILSQGS